MVHHVFAAEPSAGIEAIRHLSVEAVLLPLLWQLALIILAARAGAVLFRRLGQPSVIGEIAAGLILGPSVFGRFWPPAFEAVFHPGVAGAPPEAGNALIGWVLSVLSQLGLILLLFLIGLESDPAHLRGNGKSALAIAAAGIGFPFALGLGLAFLARPAVAADVPPMHFALFLATALSITAIPVLGRILLELGLTRTRLGSLTLAAAAVDDAAGWTLLAAVAAVVQSRYRPGQTVAMLAETVAFVLGMAVVARPLLRAWLRASLKKHGGEIGVEALAVLLAVVLACAIATNLIGIFAVFGPFVLGTVLAGEDDLRRALNRRLRDLVSAFFVPLFFAYTGLRTDVGSLATAEQWFWCGLLTAAAVAGKWLGCAAAARLCGLPWRDAHCVGAMMNTRGLMALIAINLGKDLGVVPEPVFCMLVLMALVTTLMTTPALLRLMRGTALEVPVVHSGFRLTTGAMPTALRGHDKPLR